MQFQCGAGTERCEGLVEEENARGAENRSSDRDLLLPPGREINPAFRDQFIKRAIVRPIVGGG